MRSLLIACLVITAAACGNKASPTAPTAAVIPAAVTPSAPAFYSIQGVVSDGTNNRPLIGALVTSFDSANVNRFTQTDGNGYYAFSRVQGGSLRLDITKPGYTSSFNSRALSADLVFNVTLTAVPPSVEYRITGTARHCNATYENSTGGTNQQGVSIPFSYSWSGARTGDFLYMSCQIDQPSDAGSITVGVYKNGNLYRSGTAIGFPNIATASGTY